MNDTNIDLIRVLNGPVEDLHPDLQGYIEEDGVLGPCIRHPLIFSIIHVPSLNAMINQQYKYKLEALVKAQRDRNWHSYVFLHERPYRAQAVHEIQDYMTDRKYWMLLGEVWVDSENIRQEAELWEEMLHSDRPQRHWMMTAHDRATLKGMPETFTVWQGHTLDRTDGYSWTIVEGTARWFAKRFAMLEGSDPWITTGTVRRDDVIAYMSSRNEAEIIVDPTLVFDDVGWEVDL